VSDYNEEMNKSATGNNPDAPLNGIRVLELATYLAAPACGRILAYLGADVIKVESPDGDPYRKQGALYGVPAENAYNPLFAAANDGKRFITLDLSSDNDRDIFKTLVNKSDIFITNLTELSLEKLGAGYECLKSLNPKIVYGKVSAYGRNGKEADFSGHSNAAYFARGGYMADYVQKDTVPNNLMLGAGDCNTALALSVGVLAALFGATRHGEGSRVDTSMLHTSIWLASMNYVVSQYGDDYFIDRVYKCADGIYMYVQAITEKQKSILCELLGISPEKYEDRIGMIPLLRELYASKSFAKWEEILEGTGICFERLRHIDEAAQDVQSLLNGFLTTYGGKDRSVNIPVPPISFSGADIEIKGVITHGAHTVQILEEIGCPKKAEKKSKTMGKCREKYIK